MTTDKNPRAFPCGEGIYEPGMTLRDWFAAHSLEAVMRAARQPVTDSGAIARAAYIIADAMLRERNIT